MRINFQDQSRKMKIKTERIVVEIVFAYFNTVFVKYLSS